jgi:cytochrome c peroxidase
VPGIVPGRFGNRKPPTISYAKFLPQGPPTYSASLTAYMGGLFWDGRAANLVAQIPFPLQNPNEMNNLVHNVGSPALVVLKVLTGPNARLFVQVFGLEVFTMPTSEVFELICEAIAAYEEAPEVSPFSSKYDAFLAGLVRLTASELNGLQLVTGSTTGRPGGPPTAKFAQCVLCHGIPDSRASGPDIWTNSCYANIGVPKNPNNPYYTETNSATNPVGYNSEGVNYIDLGLGGSLYPSMGLPAGNMGPHSKGDFLAINGTFKAPTLRNVDTRPSANFIKAYMHNGVFKSLAQVVHFYNTRNLTTVPGEVLDFTKSNPYAAVRGKPLWPEPEYPSPITLQNPSGLPGSAAAQVGNLQLTAQEESDIVAFLQTLSDGYFNP